MLRFTITDRRLNPNGKSLPNRQRFMERVKQSVREAANRSIKGRDINDQSDAEVSISRDGIDEPQFEYDAKKGIWDYILPGNKEYSVGDTIDKPPEGGGRGSQGSPDGDGEDDFRFYISYDEFVDAILEDLSLPDMIKETQKQTVSFTMRRAGYTTVGAASNLALERTMIHSLGRRISLKKPKLVRIEQLEEQLAEEDDEEVRARIEDEITTLKVRANAINFMEKADLRYNNFVKQPNPMTKAVVFMCMDVSGSMTEREKTIAKKFFVLLYLFLQRKYKYTDVVFIRHHHTAEECDQETFFHKPETGGTVVSTAYDVMREVIRDRYDVNEWNIYLAQASDGDNTDSDGHWCQMKLGAMLPWLQYAAYIEIGKPPSDYFNASETSLWKTFGFLQAKFQNVVRRKLTDEKQVVEVFRSLFKQDAGKVKTA
jgi:uncharacterized sporulation protein YeaH/YhbH (DUF444 family)